MYVDVLTEDERGRHSRSVRKGTEKHENSMCFPCSIYFIYFHLVVIRS